MHWMPDFARDVWYACRALRRQPMFAAVAIGTLGLALGANTAMFSLVDKVLIAHLPVHEPERLVLLSRATITPAGDTRFPYSFFRQLNEGNDLFDGVLCRMAGSERVTVGTDAGGEPALGELVSGNFFEVLGVRPHLGRLLTSSDDVTPGGHPVVVVSYRYWQRQLEGDPAVIGRTLRFTGVPMTVIGVSPPGFDGLDPGQAIDFRFPLAMQTEVRQGPPLALGGVAGVAIAAALARYTASLLYGVTPIDLVSFGASLLLITVVVAAAASLPARRAARLDPTTALREGEA